MPTGIYIRTKKRKWRLTRVRKRHYLSEKTKKKIGIALKGKKKPPFSEKHKRNLSKAGKGNKNPLGYKHTEETIKKRSGSNSHFWKGGISFEPYSIDWTDTLKKSIRQRDKYTCQICGKEPAIIIHHIDYNKKNCNPDNLITLCRSCHSKTNGNRNYWATKLD